jgi:hypothetical protein
MAGIFILLVKFDFHGEQHPAFDIEKVGCHLIETCQVPQIELFGMVEVFQKLIGNLRYGDIIDIYLRFLDKKKQKVERTVKTGSVEGFAIEVGHSFSLYHGF